jgi:hypothetical protein
VLIKSDIDSFLIDGILIYKDSKNNLFDFNNQLISEDVRSYNIYDNDIIYSSEKGLYSYNLISSLHNQLYAVPPPGLIPNEISSIEICNDKIFITVTRQGMANNYEECMYYLDPNSNSIKPLVEINNTEKQMFYNGEMGFSIEYPIGLLIQFDEGSYWSGNSCFINPVNDLFIRVMNDGYFTGPVTQDLSDREIIATYDGLVTYFYETTLDGKFYMGCITRNDYSISARGSIEHYEESKEIFIDMVKSFKNYWQ